MPLDKIELDGSETGGTAGAKINEIIDEVERIPSAVIVKGDNPAVKMEVETGGSAGVLQIYDMEAPVHLVASMEWLKAQQSVIWALNDRNSGVIKTIFELKPDGTGYIGNGMTQHKIATIADLATTIGNTPDAFAIVDKAGVDLDTILEKGRYLVDGANIPPHTLTGFLTVSKLAGTTDTIQIVEATTAYTIYERMYNGTVWSDWKESDMTHVIQLLFNMVIGKASKTSLPTIYSGDTVPLDSLGKDLDWYHHFEAGSTIDKVLYDSICRQSYKPALFAIASLYGGDTSQNNIIVIEISPHNNMIYVDLKNSATLPIEDLTLEITNHGDAPVNIPLIIHSNASGEFMGTYETSFNPVIEKIIGHDGNTQDMSSFRLKVKEGVQTSKEYDYQKHNGVWFRTDFLNTDQVNTLIREYSTIVVYDLTDSKKPTRAECIAICASNHLPHFDWALDDTFYIRDTGGGNKIVFVTYIADGATDEASAGNYFFKDMTECV